MTTPLLIYTLVTGLAVAMAFWALLTSILGDLDHSRAHRWLAGSVAIGVLATTAVAALATQLGTPRLVWAAGLLPPLILAATWSNLVSLRANGGLATVLGLPIAAFNLLQVGVYSVWFTQECIGADLGTWGCALSAGETYLQMLVGDASARDNPVWLRLPILVPLWGRINLPQQLTLLLASTYSALLLAAFAMMMPQAYRHVADYHDASPMATNRPLRIGTKVPWGRRTLSAAELDRIRVHSQLLGARQLGFDIDASTFADPERLRQVQAEVQAAKRAGQQTIAFARPTSQFASILANSADALRQDMAETHWMAAEQLQPDLLVLYSSPLSRLARLIGGSTSVDDWYEVIRKTAREARQAHPGIRLAVSLEHCNHRTAELFHRLRASDSPIDVVGLSIFPGTRLLDQVERDCRELRRWIQTSTGSRPVMILETGCSPRSHGGQRGQWNFLSRILHHAGQTAAIEVVCINSVYGIDRDDGLISRSGRRRLAYDRLAAMTTNAPATSPR